MDTTKIIKGAVSNGRYTVTAPIVKEDYGLYLQIEGVELPSTYEVDFSNSESSGTSVTMIGNADGVLIPHQFIETGKDVFAFLYHVGENFGRTVYKFRIPNKVRPDRTNEEPTPEEQSVIDQAISALNDAVEQTAQDKADADASAQSAKDDADRAEEARTDAQNYATQAEQSATDAHESASQASASASASAQSASQSAQIKADVEDLADDAQGYAQSAEQSAQNAHTYALSANAASDTAENFADVASGYASQAQSSAQTASAKAQDASQSASTASQKATESAQSASQALTYKTDAESAKTASQTAQGLAESARDSAVQAKTDAESAKDTTQTLVDGITGKVEQIYANTDAIESLEDDRYKPYATDTANGRITSFVDGADDIPLKSLTVTLEPIQDTSQGEPSPENICPISGWTGLNLKHTKKNLLPLNIWNGLNYNSSVGAVFTPTMSDRSWTQNADSISYATSATYTNMSLMTSLLPKGTYHYDLHRVSGERLRYTRYVLDKDFTVISASSSSNMSNAGASVTLDDYGYIAFRLDNGSTASQTITMTAQITVGDTETAYEPYNGTTIPINWETEAGTVYGGKLDVLTGKLTVTFIESSTLDTWNWAYYASGQYFYAVIARRFTNAESATGIGMWDRYKYYGNNTGGNLQNNMPDMCFGFTTGSANKYIYVKDSRFDNVADFKASLAGSQFVCTMSENNWVEIQLTSTEVRSLLGQNNIFADTGNTTAEYRADTKLYIERLTAPDSADMIADANIVSGQYFMVGNTLYKATANIANGAQIIVGTNCTRVSLAQALNEINA